MSSRASFLALSLGFAVLSSGCLIRIGGGADCVWHDDDSPWHTSIHESGVETTEVRSIGDFKSLEVNGSTDVTVRVGEQTSLAVTGDENIVANLRTEVVDGRLVIGLKPGSYRSVKSLKVTVTTPALEAVSVNGSADVEISGLTTGNLETRIAGSGDIAARGEIQALKASIAGSGDLKLSKLSAREASIEIAGSGNASVHAVEALSVAIQGSGDVRYSGDPKVTASVSGSGNIHKE